MVAVADIRPNANIHVGIGGLMFHVADRCEIGTGGIERVARAAQTPAGKGGRGQEAGVTSPGGGLGSAFVQFLIQEAGEEDAADDEPFDYRLRVRRAGAQGQGEQQTLLDDPYRFPPVLGELDVVAGALDGLVLRHGVGGELLAPALGRGLHLARRRDRRSRGRRCR